MTDIRHERSTQRERTNSHGSKAVTGRDPFHQVKSLSIPSESLPFQKSPIHDQIKELETKQDRKTDDNGKDKEGEKDLSDERLLKASFGRRVFNAIR